MDIWGRMFSRGVRTRSKFKIELKQQPKDDKIAQEIDNEITKIESRAQDSATNSHGGTSRRSRFSKTNSNKQIDELKTLMGYKDPEQIKKDLMKRFADDGVEPDPEFIEKMVQESNKEMDLIQKYITDPKSTNENLTLEEINHYIEWLISDGQKKISEQNGVKHSQINEELNEMIKSEDESPESLSHAFELVGQLVKDSQNSLEKLPHFLYRMTRLHNSDLSRKVPAEKWIELYSISTAIKDDKIRNQCLFLCGKLLYTALKIEYGPKMRPDPINEKFYIESLIEYNDFSKALELFHTRKTKDVKDERFWFELGAEIYIAKNDIEKAIELIDYIKENWGYVSSITLVKASKKSLNNQNLDDSLWFWEEIQMNIDKLGITDENYIPETQIMTDPKVVYEYYNRLEPVSWPMIDEIIFAFVGNMRFNESFAILNYILAQDPEYQDHFISSLQNSFDPLGLQLYVNELKDASNKLISDESQSSLLKSLGSIPQGVSIEESFLMNNILVYLNRLAEVNKKHFAVIEDLRELIKNGSKLSTFDASSLLSLLLEANSNIGLNLSTELITFMNKNNVSKTPTNSVLPKANSILYEVFCKYILSTSRPKLAVLDGVLSIMEGSNVQMDEKFANTIVTKLIINKQYAKAVSFIESYVLTDNSISVKKITDKNYGDMKPLWNTCLAAYYQLVFINKSTIDERNDLLKRFIQKIVEQNVRDVTVFSDAIGALLAFNDTPTLIAFIKWYAQSSDGNIPPYVVVGIKAKLEERLQKLDSYITDDQKVFVEQYKKMYGLEAHAITSRTKPQEVNDIVGCILSYSELFGYTRNSFTLATEISDAKINSAKTEFDSLVRARLEEFGVLSN